MGKVKSTVTINTRRIKQLTDAQIMALGQTAEDLHEDVQQAQVMPYDSGHMQGTATAVDYSNDKNGVVSLVTQTPYARRLYYHPEYNFWKKYNPNAQGRWLEPWINGDRKDFCKKRFIVHYKQIGGV